MKKKIIVNRQKLTREATLFPLINKEIKYPQFAPMAKYHSIENVNGYWKFIFKDK